jgi:TolB protein
MSPDTKKTQRVGTRQPRISCALFAVLILPLLAPADPSLVRLTADGIDVQRPAWSADGKMLAFSRHEAGGTHIWQYVMDMGASPPVARRLTKRSTPEYNGVFSPAGKEVLLTIIPQSGTQGNLDLAIIALDGSGLAKVAGDPDGGLSHQDWPSWSPDGSRFAFSSTHDGNQEIYTAKAGGSDVVRLTQSSGIDTHPCWSPLGDRIVFATDRWGGLELASIKPDGTGLTRLTTSPGLDDYPAVSPTGRLAFVSNRDGNFEIYLADPDGSHPVNFSQHPLRDTQPTWTPDGTGVTFVSGRDGGGDIYTKALPR